MRLADFIEGLQIIAKYEKGESHCLRAEHDQVWASSCDLPMTPEDTGRMEELGWFKDNGGDGWSAFP